MNLKKFLFTSLFLCALFFLLGSCREKGCTDSKAINYNITADDDDGSCIYCNNNVSTLADFSVYLKDDFFNSPHFNQNIAQFFLHQDLLTPNDMWCGSQKSTISLKVRSLITQNMYMQFRIFGFSGPVNFNTIFDDVLIEAGDTVDLGMVHTITTPPFLPLNLDSIATDLQTQVAYY